MIDYLEGILRRSPIKDITEYGRSVHAEMEALLACARQGLSCVGATLYSTTFPCHNCAKHIIASGIREVVYIEPYPKSKAFDFHDEAVTNRKLQEGEKKVRFKPFIGVGPRRFFDLFSMELSDGRPIKRKHDESGHSIEPDDLTRPRIPMSPFLHRKYEKAAANYLKYRTEEDDT